MNTNVHDKDSEFVRANELHWMLLEKRLKAPRKFGVGQGVDNNILAKAKKYLALTNDDEEKIRVVFRMFDDFENGVVPVEQLPQVLESLGFSTQLSQYIKVETYTVEEVEKTRKERWESLSEEGRKTELKMRKITFPPSTVVFSLEGLIPVVAPIMQLVREGGNRLAAREAFYRFCKMRSPVAARGGAAADWRSAHSPTNDTSSDDPVLTDEQLKKMLDYKPPHAKEIEAQIEILREHPSVLQSPERHRVDPYARRVGDCDTPTYSRALFNEKMKAAQEKMKENKLKIDQEAVEDKKLEAALVEIKDYEFTGEDNKLFLDKEGVRKAFAACEAEISERDLEYIMLFCDLDRDGKIGLKDWLACMSFVQETQY